VSNVTLSEEALNALMKMLRDRGCACTSYLGRIDPFPTPEVFKALREGARFRCRECINVPFPPEQF
jgi:hypothetical protein